jgi:hypothetical protein
MSLSQECHGIKGGYLKAHASTDDYTSFPLDEAIRNLGS